jgi:hypothetical protein
MVSCEGKHQWISGAALLRTVMHYTSQHVTRHTSHVTRHTSHVTRHTSHVTRHTSHVTRCTSRITRHRLTRDLLRLRSSMDPASACRMAVPVLEVACTSRHESTRGLSAAKTALHRRMCGAKWAAVRWSSLKPATEMVGQIPLLPMMTMPAAVHLQLRLMPSPRSQPFRSFGCRQKQI